MKRKILFVGETITPIIEIMGCHQKNHKGTPKNSKIQVLVYSVLIIIMGLIISCGQETSQDGTPIIDFSRIEVDSNKLLLSDFCKTIQYFTLETNDSCLISEIHDVHFTDSLIIVFDIYLGVVRSFSKDGKFIKDLHLHRDIVGDSSRIHQVYYDSHNDIVTLYTNGRKIHRYSGDGNYLNSAGFDTIIPFYVYPIKDKYLLYFPYPRSLGFGNYSFGIVNKSLEVIKQFGYRKLTWTPQESDIVYFPVSYNFHDTLCFWNLYCDTVFGIVADNIFLRYVLRNSKPLSSKKNYYRVKTGKYRVGRLIYKFFESREYLFIESSLNRKRNYLIYDKKKMTASLVKSGNASDPDAIKNNVDYGVPFWPDKCIGDTLMMYVSSERMINYLDNVKDADVLANKNFKLLQDKLSKINIQNNPLIMLIEGKDEL
ncbi:MAG: 6-bladed beta-propeller [Bacteroidota bacterium]|nr:6-bladed beta-propeller [Bacteroidota bacterium]